jgi:UDP-N-acetylglucosamine--N-acetylmuramyl-(pentapeptide) pyrophosphoryl-undecaprenol N-acetylglucosamine transferase
MVKPIVIAAGGTGGHVFPAEALAAALIARGHRVVLMTDARSGALKSPVFAGHEQFVLPGAGIAGRGIWRGARAVLALAAGTARARRLLKTLSPAAIVGFGGYPCVAPVVAAQSLRRRPFILLHEQNAVLGRANRMLARLADVLALGAVRTARVPAGLETFAAGNPVRPAIAALSGQAYVPPGDTINLLVLGGSLGARIFSDVVPATLAGLPDSLRHRIALVQQCRVEDIARVRTACRAAGVEPTLAPFFTDMPDRLRAAHLVVARAGASTCAELAVCGRPSILVPLPGAIDDHQTANAGALAEAGAAEIIAQSTLTPALLAARLRDFLESPDRLASAAASAAEAGKPRAADTLADFVLARSGLEKVLTA